MPTRQDGVENREKVYSAILLGCVRLGDLDLDFKIRIRIYNRTRNPKTDFTEIMLRHLFLDFHFYRSIMKSEKGFEKYSTKSEIY